MDVLTTVKLAIYDHFTTTAHAPSVSDVAQRLNLSVDAVQAAFDELHTKRLLVPEPGDKSRIRMAPPFSGVPTSFKVHVQTKRYDANCVWDGLGVLAALHTDGMVRARDGHSGEAMTLVIREGSPKPTPCVIHFAVPAAHWWDDVIYTCSTMLLFRSEETVQAWCAERNLPVRPLITLDQMWVIAQEWYSDRLTAESRRPGPDEMKEIFARIGLTDPFWDPKAP